MSDLFFLWRPDLPKRLPVRLVATPIASGGAGRIHRLAPGPTTHLPGPEQVAKIYHRPDFPADRRERLRAMLAAPPDLPPLRGGRALSHQLAWPTGILEDEAGATHGFLMPLLQLDRAAPLELLLTRRGRKTTKLPESYAFRVAAAQKLALVVSEIHGHGHHVVDLKPLNVHVYVDGAGVALLDCDGFSIGGAGGTRYPGHQYTDGYIAPEALRARHPPQALGEEHDRFALAVVLFQVLNQGLHPYQGRPRGRSSSTTNNERVAEGFYAYGRIENAELAPSPWSIHDYFDDETRHLFDRAFAGPPAGRPRALEWAEHLASYTSGVRLRRCRRNRDHAHFSRGCGLCATEPAGPKPVATPSPPEPAAPVAAAQPATAARRRKVPLIAVVLIALAVTGAVALRKQLSREALPLVATEVRLPRRLEGMTRNEAAVELDRMVAEGKVSPGTRDLLLREFDTLRPSGAPRGTRRRAPPGRAAEAAILPDLALAEPVHAIALARSHPDLFASEVRVRTGLSPVEEAVLNALLPRLPRDMSTITKAIETGPASKGEKAKHRRLVDALGEQIDVVRVERERPLPLPSAIRAASLMAKSAWSEAPDPETTSLLANVARELEIAQLDLEPGLSSVTSLHRLSAPADAVPWPELEQKLSGLLDEAFRVQAQAVVAGARLEAERRRPELTAALQAALAPVDLPSTPQRRIKLRAHLGALEPLVALEGDTVFVVIPFHVSLAPAGTAGAGLDPFAKELGRLLAHRCTVVLSGGVRVDPKAPVAKFRLTPTVKGPDARS